MLTQGKSENKDPFLNRNKAIIEELARNPNNLYYAGDTKLKPSFNPNDDFIPAVFHKLSADGRNITPYNFKFPYKFDKTGTRLFNGNSEIGKTVREEVSLMIEGKTESKNFTFHHLQLVSLNPHFNWLPFHQGIENGTLSVDHLLGNHERCHPNLLEVVPKDENRRRTGYFERTETEIQGDIQRSESNSIPVSLFENGEPRCDENGIIEYKNAYECAKAIYKGEYDEDEIIKLDKKIRNRLNGTTPTPTIKGYEEFTYKYGQRYLDIQKPIKYDVYVFENKIWKLNEKGVLEVVITFEELEEWRQKMIKDKFKKNIPEGVAKSGRINIKTNQKIGLRNMTYGKWDKKTNIRYYNSSCIYALSLYWFGTIEEIELYEQKKIDNEKIMICHNDGEFPHPCVKRPSDVGEDGEENSNQWGTFRVDTESNNGRDRSYAKLRKDEKKKEGHFKAFNKNGEQIGDRIFFSPQHFNIWAKENEYKEKFKSINTILNPDKYNKTEQGLTFERHIYPSETPIEV
tara:strand:- start:178 stop:1722 length:1545 start_codon:yes stop_codon:yes gene_type:complete